MMTKLSTLFGTKIKPIAFHMNVPPELLKADLRRLTSGLPLEPHVVASETYHGLLSEVYPHQLLPVLLRYNTPQQLLTEARWWAHISDVSDELYYQPAKESKRDKMTDVIWTSCFAYNGWKRGFYVPSKGDWRDFKEATR